LVSTSITHVGTTLILAGGLVLTVLYRIPIIHLIGTGTVMSEIIQLIIPIRLDIGQKMNLRML
jgi:hypothetical protein